MKKVKLVALLCAVSSFFSCNAQQPEVKRVEEIISAFSKAGDQNNADQLSLYLDENYRIVMNRLFGSEEVSVMSRSVYLSKIQSKEFGGDDREVKINNVIINGNTAIAQVTFKGQKMTVISTLLLVQDKQSEWKLICDVPVIQ